MGHHRLLDYLTIDFYQGDENMVLAANPGRLSADVLRSVGGCVFASAKRRTRQNPDFAEAPGTA